MDKQKAIQIAAASALTLTVGGAGLYYGLNYWSGGDFLPSGQARALKANQVLFEEDSGAKDQSDSGSQSDRSAWEKDNTADRQEIPEQGKGSDYLFQSGDNRGTAAGIAGEGGGASTGNLPDQIFTPDGNGDVIINGGSSGTTPGQKPEEEEKPGIPDYSHVADPAPEKTPSFGDSPYQESSASDDITFYIEPSLWSEYPLYKGQSIDDFTLFCQLDTYIMDNTTFSTFYLTEEHYGKYIQVDSVCFTPGKQDEASAWQSKFPLTIPEDCSSFLVKVKYRASLSGAWQTATVEFVPKDCCVYVLKKAPQDSDTVFTVDNILNYGSSSTPSEGETINLLYYVSQFLGGSDKPLTRLYKGWTENGEYVPWRYTATSGRHILLPGEFTEELDPGLTVVLKNYYLDENLEEKEFGDLSYLQTLTGADAAGKNLQVPYYMQAVLLDGVAADTLTLPDTVSVVKGMGMDIRWAYAVSETNPHFSTVTSGPLARLLLSKDKTKILAVPTSIRELTVPASVTEVAPLGGNALNKLTLQAKSAQELPALDLESSYNLSEIHVSSYDVMEALFKDNWAYLEANPQVKVTCDEYPGISFEAREGSIIGSDDKLYRVVREDISTITLPNGVTEILPGACLDRPNLKSISLPLDGAPVRLDENSLAGSGLTGLFYQESQKADLLRDLPRSGAPESLVLSLLSVSKEGISYEIAQDGTVTLLRASDDIETFDGTVTTQDGTVLSPNVIGAGCFAECTSLTWVTLPDTVTAVGEYAFRNCSNLQGLMMEATGGLTLGENCLEGCSMLSFVAVNDPIPTLPESLSSSKLSCRCFYPYDGEHVIWGDWTGYIHHPVAEVNPVRQGSTRRGLHKLLQQGCHSALLVDFQGNAAVERLFQKGADPEELSFPDARKTPGNLGIYLRCLPAETGVDAPGTQCPEQQGAQNVRLNQGLCPLVAAAEKVQQNMAGAFKYSDHEKQHQDCSHQEKQRPAGTYRPENLGAFGSFPRIAAGDGIRLIVTADGGGGFGHILRQANQSLQGYHIVVIAGGGIQGNPAHAVQIGLYPGVGLSPCDGGRAGGAEGIGRNIVAFGVPGRDAVGAQGLYGGGGK